MKCPKCGYMSFDFNEICPKCQRNIISVRDKMNHLPFKPEPPFLLATLLAQTGDSQVGMELSQATIVTGTQETMLPMEEPPALDIDLDKAPSMEIEFDRIPPDQAVPESYTAPPHEEPPVPIEDFEFEKEEPPDEEELVEVSTGTYTSPLDEETLSLELEDLLEAEKKLEPVLEKEPDEEAMTIEMDALESLEAEPSPETATEFEKEGPEELFDSFDIGEIEPVEEKLQPGEDVIPEPPVPPPEPTPGEPDELFSPDDLKGYKIGQFNILSQPGSGKSHRQTDSSEGGGAKTPPEAKGVWDEITKDLEDLEFDIDDS